MNGIRNAQVALCSSTMSSAPSHSQKAMGLRRASVAASWMVLVGASIVLTACSQATVRDNRLAFELPDLEGNTVSMPGERFEGKVVLVDIWGTWCPPCHAQIPHLAALHRKYGDQGLEVVGINFEMLVPSDAEKYRASMKAFASKLEIPYLLLIGGDVSEVETALPAIRGFTGFPTGVFIGRDGLVRKVTTGFLASDVAAFEATIEALLEESPN